MPPVLRPWNCALSGAADTTIEAYRQRQGDAAEWVARSSGQYQHTDDLLYGGAGPPISDWQETVLFRSRQVSQQVPEGLTAGRHTLDGPICDPSATAITSDSSPQSG